MALACHQNHVGRFGAGNRVGDGGAPVHLHFGLRVAGESGQDVRNDCRGLFAARVVAGDDDLVGPCGGNRAHQRALVGVAVATAAKHAPQLTRALLCERAQGVQGLG